MSVWLGSNRGQQVLFLVDCGLVLRATFTSHEAFAVAEDGVVRVGVVVDIALAVVIFAAFSCDAQFVSNLIHMSK